MSGSHQRLRWIITAVLAVACGARSGLRLDDGARPDSGTDAGIDSGRDAGPDRDAGADADADAAADAKPDVVLDGPVECPTPDATFIYAVMDDARLLAFRPEDNSFTTRGVLKCPNTFDTPFSMAIDSNARAFVEYSDGQLFEVDVFDVSCTPTGYVPAPPDTPFNLFGMGFAVDDVTNQETLFVADIDFETPSDGLARIDTQSFERTFIGPFSQNPGNAVELTSGGDGRLWGYFLHSPASGGTLARIDSASAQIIESHALSAGNGDTSMAVAFWVGAFYVFTGNDGLTTVTRFEPGSQISSVVATTAGHVVGAAVAPCASIGAR